MPDRIDIYRRMLGAIAIACVLFIRSFTIAAAADICEALVLRDVPAIEDPNSILKKGTIDGQVTEYQVNKLTGQTSLCSHGGYCYPMRIELDGAFVEALKLTNCRIVGVRSYDDGENLIYEVDPIRSIIPPDLLRYDDLDNKFLNLGLCSACAKNVTKYYLSQPKSQCAQLARLALEGNHEALDTLLQGPSYCVWPY